VGSDQRLNGSCRPDGDDGAPEDLVLEVEGQEDQDGAGGDDGGELREDQQGACDEAGGDDEVGPLGTIVLG
jgi:hypothetical protein